MTIGGALLKRTRRATRARLLIAFRTTALFATLLETMHAPPGVALVGIFPYETLKNTPFKRLNLRAYSKSDRESLYFWGI